MLSDAHRESLEVGSGIAPSIIEARGYDTVTKRSELARRGFGLHQRRVPAILIPLHHVKGGTPNRWQIRPDDPRKNKNGKPLKYEYVWGKAPILDCPPVELMRDCLNTPKAPIFITEGSKKADAAVSKEIPCLSLAGVYNWRGTNEHGVKVTISDLDEIDWKERPIYICFDNDVMWKEEVYWSLVRLSGILQRRDGIPYFVSLPPGDDNKGLDDYLVNGGTKDGLFHLSGQELPAPQTVFYTPNDRGMAMRVADAYNDEILFDNTNDSWYVWGGASWQRDRPGAFARRYILDYTDIVREEARGLSEVPEAGQKRSPRAMHTHLATTYGNAGPVAGAEKMLKSFVAEQNPGFDEKPDLLNMPNGTLDLTTGEFREHRPSDRLTTMTNARWPITAAEEQCPTWLQFMEERFPNVETREYIQRMCGLFMTGNAPEKAFFIVRGDPDCGKTVFVETIQELLGDYANKVDKTTLTKGKGGDNKQLERAVELVGKRMVFVDESAQGDQIDDAVIKEITGGDTTLKFRRLYEQAGQAKAQFTIVMATNFKPKITGNDAALWRRCHLIEFGQPIPKEAQIGDFKSRLMAEAAGILKWCVDGYRSWLTVGMEIPTEVKLWTTQYQEENDPLGRFMTECYEIGEHVTQHTTPKALVAHYVAWCEENEITVKTLKDSSNLSKAVRARWPIVNEGNRAGKSRKLFHMRSLQEFRATDGLEAFLEQE